MNGVVGLKPTQGRLPRSGHVLGYGGAFDAFVEVGLLARSVDDLALLLPILCGPDGSDAALAPVPLLDPGSVDLGSLRIARWGESAAVGRCAELLEALGTRVTAAAPPRLEEFAALRARYRGGDGKAHVRRLLQRYGTQKTSPGLPLNGEIVPSPELSRLCEELDHIRSEQLAWAESRDLVILPAGIAGPAGWPAGIIPCGTGSDGLPVAAQLVAPPWREDILLAALTHLDEALGRYPAPTLPRSVA